MLRTIELGRAVLCLPPTDLELWLTTLITISPQERLTDFQRFTTNQIISLLLSGSVWLTRSSNLYLELCPTLSGEPFIPGWLEQIAQKILDAPVWRQLLLQPILSDGFISESPKLKFDIKFNSEHNAEHEQRTHKYFKDVNYADTRPPNGISTYFLHSISCDMAIQPNRQRQKATKKKPKTATIHSMNISAIDLQHESQTPCVNTSPDDIPSGISPEASMSTVELGSKVSVTTTPSEQRIPSSRVARSPTNSKKRCANGSISHLECQNDISASHDNIEQLIDGALRLAVCGALATKLIPGLKVEANSFRAGLSDIAPSLWKPNYLLSLSARARILPEISQSISRVKAQSSSLAQKLALVTRDAEQINPKHLAAHIDDIDEQASVVASRIWCQFPKDFSKKPLITINAFLSTKSKALDEEIGGTANQLSFDDSHTMLHDMFDMSERSEDDILFGDDTEDDEEDPLLLQTS